MTTADPDDRSGTGVALTRTATIIETIAAPIEAVWPVVSDFSGIGRYMAGVTVLGVEGDGVGAIRTIAQPGAPVRERLESFDPAAYAFSYRVLDPSPLPMRDYVGHVRLAPEGTQACRIEWGGSFATDSSPDPVARKLGLEAFYGNCISGLRAALKDG